MLVALCSMQLLATDYWKNPLYQQDFTDLTALPAGLTKSNRGTGMASTNSSANNLEVKNDMIVIHYEGNNAGGRGVELKFTNPFQIRSEGEGEEDTKMRSVDFDVRINNHSLGTTATLMIHLMGSNTQTGGSSSTNSVDGKGFISCVYLCAESGMWHVWGQNTGDLELTPAQFASVSLPDWQDNMETNVAFVPEAWYHLEYILNFDTKKMSVTITQNDNPENTQTIQDLDFISDEAPDFQYINIAHTRPSGGNSNYDFNLDNLQISEMVASEGQASVTVHYKDLDGNTIKPDRVDPDQEISLEYYLTAEDKASFSSGGFYYAYDMTAMEEDFVVVAGGGVEITAKFKKSPLTAGTYTWKGNNSELWNELDLNFTTDGANTLPYQNGNNVQFSDAGAPKDVIISGNMIFNNNSMVINTEGYNITGAGSLSGTGKIEVNASASLGFLSKLPDPLELKAGTLEVTNVDLAKSYSITGGTTLKLSTSSDFSKEVAVTGEVLNIEANQNSNPYSLKISGDELKTVNINLLQSGQNKTPTWPNNWSGTTFPENVAVNVTTALTDTTAAFAFGGANLEKCTVTLGDNVRAFNFYNNENKGARLKFGALNGTAGSTLEGGFVDAVDRVIAYEVGGLGTDATFEGTIKNYGATTVAPLNIYKVGAGKWTLTGNSGFTSTMVSVDEGTLVIEGALGMADPEANYLLIKEARVAEGAVLAGSGELNALDVTVSGTITDNLSIIGNLIMTLSESTMSDDGGIMLINVNGNDIDKVTLGGELYYGGKLKVNVTALPEAGDYQIIEAGDYIPVSEEYGFESLDLPTGFTFSWETGILSYDGSGSSIDNIEAAKVIESKEYYDLTGKVVNKDYKGFVIIKTKYTDNTTKILKAIRK